MGPYTFIDQEGHALPVTWPEITPAARAYADANGFTIRDAAGTIVYPEEG